MSEYRFMVTDVRRIRMKGILAKLKIIGHLSHNVGICCGLNNRMHGSGVTNTFHIMSGTEYVYRAHSRRLWYQIEKLKTEIERAVFQAKIDRIRELREKIENRRIGS